MRAASTYGIYNRRPTMALAAKSSATASSAAGPLLTVLVPAYNEAGTIDELLRRVLAAPPLEKQVVVVDDGSTDATGKLVLDWERRKLVDTVQHQRNRGKGAAIRTGICRARGEFTIVQDADLEYNPNDYERLLEPLIHDQAQVVYGSRYLSPERRTQARWRLLRLGVSLLNLCVRLLYGVRLTDEATCYKVFPTTLLRSLQLECEGFEFCPEVTAKLCRLGIPILEVPIRYEPRTKSAGKKIRLRDGVTAVREFWRWRKWNGAIPDWVDLGVASSNPQATTPAQTSRHGCETAEPNMPCSGTHGTKIESE